MNSITLQQGATFFTSLVAAMPRWALPSHTLTEAYLRMIFRNPKTRRGTPKLRSM